MTTTLFVVIVSIITGFCIGCETSRQGRFAQIITTIWLPPVVGYSVIVFSRLPELGVHFGDARATAVYGGLSALVAYLVPLLIWSHGWAHPTAPKP
jgi:hypothetical protein